MYDVTKTFIENSTKHGRRLSIRITWGNVVFEDDKVFSFSKSFDGDLFSTVMQSCEGVILGKHNFENAVLKVELGISFDNLEYEYVDYGNFMVREHEIIIGSHNTQDRTFFKGYDAMLNSHYEFDLNELNLWFPTTIYDLYVEIANYMGLGVSGDSILNGTKVIQEDKWTGVGELTFRDVLDEIAETSASSIIIKNNNLHSKNIVTEFTNLGSPIFTDFVVYEEI